jgi:hypothetical protein
MKKKAKKSNIIRISISIVS